MKAKIFHGRPWMGVLGAVAWILSASGAAAATYIWDGETSSDWRTASNWDATPTFVAGTELVFHAASPANVDSFVGNMNTIVGGLTFNDNVDSALTIYTRNGIPGTGNATLILQASSGSAFINVASGAEGDIAIAPGGGRIYFDSHIVIDHQGSGDLSIGQWCDDRGAGHSITKSGSGTFSLTSANVSWNYSGGLIINAGKVRLAGGAAAGSGTLVMTGGTLSSIGATTLTLSNPYDFSGSLTLGDATDTGAITFQAAATGTLKGNTTVNTIVDLTLNGAVGEDGGAYSLTKTGAATLTLGTGNSFSGGLNINGGLVNVANSDGRLGAAGGTLSFDGGALTFIGAGVDTAISRDTTLNAGGGSIGVLYADRSITWNNTITGVGGLTKIGDGTLYNASGSHTFQGGLNLNGGIFSVANGDNRLGANNGAVSFDGGALRFHGSGVDMTTSDRTTTLNAGGGAIDIQFADRTISWAGVISGAGDFTKTGVGTLQLTRDNDYSGATTVAAGTLQINGTHTGGGLITVQSGGTLGGTGSAGNAKIESGGILAPGNSVGELTLGELTLDGGSTLAWEFDGVGGVDELNLDGLWQGTGTGWTFDFLNTGHQGTFTLIRFTAGQTDFTTGDFAIANLNPAYSAPDGIQVNSGAGEITLNVIPEPASLGSLGMIALAAILRRRLRR